MLKRKRTALSLMMLAFPPFGLLIGGNAVAQPAPDVAALQALGKHVFFDRISNPPRQACADCHVPATGWSSGVNAGLNVHGVGQVGADPSEVGGRKVPSNAYASFKPDFNTPPPGALFSTCLPGPPFGIPLAPFCFGGVFWDGRAEGEGNNFGAGIPSVGHEVFIDLPGDYQTEYEHFLGPLADQFLGPFTESGPEQNVPANPGIEDVESAIGVCEHVASAQYAPLFEAAWGEPINCTPDDGDPTSHEPGATRSFKRIAVAGSAYQHTDEVNQFSSKRDMALADDNDGHFPLDDFTDEENLGHDLFYNIESELNPDPDGDGPLEHSQAGCVACHNSGPSFFGFVRPPGTEASVGEEPKQVYMDFAYHNLGLPPNPEISLFDPNNPDRGLCGHTGDAGLFAGLCMHFATPTLRNVGAQVGNGTPRAFMHNGYFKSLEQVIHFYNTAEAKLSCEDDLGLDGLSAAEAIANNCWPEPELEVGNEARGGLFGNLGLTEAEEAALVAYLETLTDTELKDVKKPRPHTGR